MVKKICKWAALALLAALLAFVCYVAWDDTHVTLTNYEYYNDLVPNAFYGYRIMAVADFHNAYYADQIAAIVNRESPDLLLLLGDMTSLPDNATDNLEKLLNGITVDTPVYAVTGNHETYAADSAAVKARLQALPLTLLENERVTIEKDGESIDLLGVWDTGMATSELPTSWGLGEIRAFLKGAVTTGRLSVLACHRADMYPMLSDLPVDLMLAGHMHGGVVRLPFVGGLFGEDGDFMPDYDAGFYQETDMTLLVSRGCDFTLLKPRVLNGPEVVQVTLKK